MILEPHIAKSVRRSPGSRSTAAVVIALATIAVLVTGSCTRGEDPQEARQDRSMTTGSFDWIQLGMSRRAIEKRIEAEDTGSRVLETAHLGNQSRIIYGNPSNAAARVVVHYEDGRVVESVCPATSRRLPPEPKERFALSVGMSESACHAVLCQAPGLQRYGFPPQVDDLGREKILYGDPRDARTTIVVKVKDQRLVSARWFGTGESLLSENAR